MNHPRRGLLAVLLFVVVAGVLGGPVAGVLEDASGFTPTDSGSARAVERIEAATGRQAVPGVVLLVGTPPGAATRVERRRLAALRTELTRQPGVVAVAGAQDARDTASSARDGRSSFLAATLDADADADADEDAAVSALQERFGDGLGLGARRLAGRTKRATPSPSPLEGR